MDAAHADRPGWPAHLTDLRDRLDPVLRDVAFRVRFGAALEGWGPGWAVVTATPTHDVTNLAGTVHGGYLAALADCALEVACNSYGRLAVASQFSAHYAAPARPGEPLRAEAVERTRSRRFASYAITVTAADTVVAWLQAVAYRTERWHVDEDTVPEEWRRTS